MSSPAAHRRPNRSAAQRREQYQRAHARLLSGVLKACTALSSHRGNSPSQVLASLAQQLQYPGPSSTAAASQPPAFSDLDHRLASLEVVISAQNDIIGQLTQRLSSLDSHFRDLTTICFDDEHEGSMHASHECSFVGRLLQDAH